MVLLKNRQLFQFFFVLGKIGQKDVFHHILEWKNAFLD